MNKKYLPAIIGLLVIFITLAGADCAYANEAKSMLDTFERYTQGWWSILQGYARDIFLLTLTLEIAVFGIRMGIQHTSLNEILGQFVMLLLFACFIAAVIANYEDWSKAIAINGLNPVVKALNPGVEVADAGKPFALAAKVWEMVLQASSGAGFWDFPKVFIMEIIALILCVVLALISALVIIVTCEFYIIANVSILLIGLGGSKTFFKEYAINSMRYVVSVAVKLFVLKLIVNIGFTILTMASIQQHMNGSVKVIEYQDLFLLVGQAIILLALAKSLPDTCAGILNGSSIGSGNPLFNTARAAGGMAAGAAVSAASAGLGFAAGAAKATSEGLGMISNVRELQKGGKAESGFGGMVKTLSEARAQSKIDSNPHTVGNILQSRVNAMEEEKKMNQELSDTSDSGPVSSPESSIMANQAEFAQASGTASNAGGASTSQTMGNLSESELLKSQANSPANGQEAGQSKFGQYSESHNRSGSANSNLDGFNMPNESGSIPPSPNDASVPPNSVKESAPTSQKPNDGSFMPNDAKTNFAPPNSAKDNLYTPPVDNWAPPQKHVDEASESHKNNNRRRDHDYEQNRNIPWNNKK